VKTYSPGIAKAIVVLLYDKAKPQWLCMVLLQTA